MALIYWTSPLYLYCCFMNLCTTVNQFYLCFRIVKVSFPLSPKSSQTLCFLIPNHIIMAQIVSKHCLYASGILLVLLPLRLALPTYHALPNILLYIEHTKISQISPFPLKMKHNSLFCPPRTGCTSFVAKSMYLINSLL